MPVKVKIDFLGDYEAMKTGKINTTVFKYH